MEKAERIKNFCEAFQISTTTLIEIGNNSITVEDIDTWYENINKLRKKSIEDRKKAFYNKLIPSVDEYGKELVREFYEHWTQVNENGKKLHFEKETTFEISRRLKTFKRNNDTNFGKRMPSHVLNSPNVIIPNYAN
jgi:hypothetical protein